MTGKELLFKAGGWFFGVLFLLIGLINIFWGNDPVFGAGIAVLSFLYLPLVNSLIKEKTGFRIHIAIKIVLGLFILWAALGVGELFDKTEMMLRDLAHLYERFFK
ncbi:MAG: hypothetical protein MUE37_03330 [Bacteroidales bacterium]|jgi:hypothetical protein|nr:hypothetical protein [Bacteroidales bacterium]